MPAADRGWGAYGRPASENLQGRKPREGGRGRFVARYGGLSAARMLGVIGYETIWGVGQRGCGF
jgi:hypothetical protein